MGRKKEVASVNTRTLLIVGIVVVVFVLLLISPFRETLFGQVISTGGCGNIQILVATGGVSSADVQQKRRDTCESTGCVFSGWDVPVMGRANIRNDQCNIGLPTECPAIFLFSFTGNAANLGRHQYCNQVIIGGRRCNFVEGMKDNPSTIISEHWNSDGDLCLASENCVDGVDDDRDGAIDCADSQCHGLYGPSGELCESKEKKCADGFDNDGDGAVDCDDTNCRGRDGCPS